MLAVSSDTPVAFVDVETTGGHTACHCITEIGLVAARGGCCEYEWSTFFNPCRRIPAQRIAWTETAGELGAALLQARLVREFRPLYNKRLRVVPLDEV